MPQCRVSKTWLIGVTIANLHGLCVGASVEHTSWYEVALVSWLKAERECSLSWFETPMEVSWVKQAKSSASGRDETQFVLHLDSSSWRLSQNLHAGGEALYIDRVRTP